MNPFKVGDKVKLKKRSYEFNPTFWRKYGGFKYSFVGGVVGDTISTSEDSSPQHYSHFELYKEEKDMTPQTQPKTKRVPFTHELWEKWKDKGGKVIYASGPHIIKDMVCFDNAVTTHRYAGYCEERDCVYVCEGDEFSLEIPVTTKRIPFNPELKAAKVFYGKTELIEWVRMSSDVVCGVYEQLSPFKSLETALYHPNHLEMEIDE